MLEVRYLGRNFPKVTYAQYVLFGESEITLFDIQENEIMSLSYDVVISIIGT